MWSVLSEDHFFPKKQRKDPQKSSDIRPVLVHLLQIGGLHVLFQRLILVEALSQFLVLDVPRIEVLSSAAMDGEDYPHRDYSVYHDLPHWDRMIYSGMKIVSRVQKKHSSSMTSAWYVQTLSRLSLQSFGNVRRGTIPI